jgi:glucan 1,4-alpha-glucosidase
MKKAFLSALFYLLFSFSFAQNTWKLVSPDGLLEIQIVEQGGISYAVSHLGNKLIQPSALGFILNKPELELTEFEVLGTTTSSYDQSWAPEYGEISSIQDRHKELVLRLRSKTSPAVLVNLVFRAFNDGLGFRYEFPEQEGFKHFIVGVELTEFKLGEDHLAFWIPGDYDTNEFLYNTTRLSEVSALEANAKEVDIAVKSPIGDSFIQTPLQLVTDGGYYLHIHEAALVNYPVMQLSMDKSDFTLTSHLVPDAVGNKAYLQTEFKTPWRSIIVSKSPEGILASDLILNLNDPAPDADYSWIKPQKFIGVWWEMHVGKGTWDYSSGKHAANTAKVKKNTLILQPNME